MELCEMGINMAGCRYIIRPCEKTQGGAEMVIRSVYGRLLTEKHDLVNLFILPIDSEYVVIETVN